MAKQEMKCSYHVVAWLDLLGQREMLKRIGLMPSMPEEAAEFRQAVLNARGRVKEFRAMIRGLREGRSGNEKDGDEFSNSQWDIIAQAIWNRHSGIRVELEMISDAVLLKVDLKETRAHDPLNSVLALCEIAQLVVLSSLSKRFSVRGGIDRGVGFEIEADSLYGPVVVNAYELESKRADYPRLVFGPSFMGYLVYKEKQAQESGIDPREADLICDFLRQIRQLITFDVDGLPVLNFLSGAGVPKEPFESLVQDAMKFVEGEVARFRQEGGIDLFMRYSRLWNFMRAHAPKK